MGNAAKSVTMACPQCGEQIIAPENQIKAFMSKHMNKHFDKTPLLDKIFPPKTQKPGSIQPGGATAGRKIPPPVTAGASLPFKPGSPLTMTAPPGDITGKIQMPVPAMQPPAIPQAWSKESVSGLIQIMFEAVGWGYCKLKKYPMGSEKAFKMDTKTAEEIGEPYAKILNKNGVPCPDYLEIVPPTTRLIFEFKKGIEGIELQWRDRIKREYCGLKCTKHLKPGCKLLVWDAMIAPPGCHSPCQK